MVGVSLVEEDFTLRGEEAIIVEIVNSPGSSRGGESKEHNAARRNVVVDRDGGFRVK